MKKTISLLMAVLMLVFSLCSCGDEEVSATKVPEFNMTAVEFVAAFNNSCPETLDGVGALDVADKVDDSTNYAQHAFNNYTSFILDTDKVQKAVLWVTPEGMRDEDSLYKFGAYSNIMISAFTKDETEFKAALAALRFEEELPYGYQNTYENDEVIIYFSHDDAGLKLLIMPIEAKVDYADLLPPAPTKATTTPPAAS